MYQQGVLSARNGHRFIKLRRTRRQKSIVRIAPDPSLSRLNRTDQRVVCLLHMSMHVLVLGCIAAAHVSTDQAHAQVGPAIAKVNTILADIRAGLADLDQVQM